MIKKKYILLSLVLILFLLNIDLVIESVFYSTELFISKIFVAIFPFIILSEILIYFDYHIFLSNTIGKPLSKLFNIDKNLTIVFILSLLTSQPSNSIYIKSLLDKKIINEKSANKIITYTYFPSIAFTIGIGYSIFNNIKIGLLLLIINYICNISIGIFLRNKKTDYCIDNKINNNKSFFETLSDAIIKSIKTCLIIFGNITMFTIIINIFNNYISLNPIINSILCGLLELTSGIDMISLLNIPLNIKIFLVSFILNFSSLSIIFQSKSILSKYNIEIKKILLIKLVFSLLFSLICLLI